MLDGLGRTIDYIRISVTDRCNLRCVYCMPKEGVPQISHEEILTYDEIEEVCRVLADLGISKIKLTGGEPLVRKGLPALVKQLKAVPGIRQVTLTTNGCLLETQLDDLIQAGLDGVNISIDTLDEKRYSRLTRGGRLEDALAGLYAAVRAEAFPVKVNCVPIYGEEKEELLSIVRLAKEAPIHVRFIEMMPIGWGRNFTQLPEDEIKKLLEETYGQLTPYDKVLGNGPGHYYTLEGFRGKIGFISAVSHKFCSFCNRIRLTPEGFLKTCLEYSGGVDLRAVLRGEQEDAKRREALKEAVLLALKEKPACHHFGEEIQEDTEQRGMSRIGG